VSVTSRGEFHFGSVTELSWREVQRSRARELNGDGDHDALESTKEEPAYVRDLKRRRLENQRASAIGRKRALERRMASARGRASGLAEDMSEEEEEEDDDQQYEDERRPRKHGRGNNDNDSRSKSTRSRTSRSSSSSSTTTSRSSQRSTTNRDFGSGQPLVFCASLVATANEAAPPPNAPTVHRSGATRDEDTPSLFYEMCDAVLGVGTASASDGDMSE
jgi:hypothetical protein